MKYIVLDSFKAQTRQGETELKAGQVITLPHETAIRLLNEGRIKPAEKVAYKVYSNILQAHLWIVDTDANMHSLSAEGVSEPIYTNEEIQKLNGIDKEGLRAVHDVKTVFDESQIKSVRLTKQSIFDTLFHDHMERLRQYDLLPHEIDPSRLARIHEAIDKMDAAWLEGNLTKFKEAMNETDFLFMRAALGSK